jgi:hypothetical protein
VYHIFKRTERVNIILSQQALFIQSKSKTSLWSILYIAFWILFNPFNVKQYHDIYAKIRYNRAVSKVGTRYDFSRIPLTAITKIQAFENSKRWGIIIGIICIGIGLLSGFSLPILLLGAVIFIINIIPKKTYTISLYINRSQIEGTWHLAHDKTILKLTNLKPEMANLFTPIKLPPKKIKIKKNQANLQTV